MAAVASRWSSEQVVAEYRDLQANAMAVDCSGQYSLLAGRRFLALVDLDRPKENIRKLGRQSKWEISAVQWNPHTSHSNLFVTACNQRADVCSWSESSCDQQGSLKAHTRVISDLDWSPQEANTLATCSVDTFTYIWDIRDYRKPSVSLQAVAGASQVKWNRVNGNLLATTHDGGIRIWDPRKGAMPIQYIPGHLSKIYGLDWSPTSEYQLATSSQDCTVKFWDITNPRQAEKKVPSGSPVWRARYTPFGAGLMTVVVPQLRRGENSLFLWHIEDVRQPVHTFVGHSDVVLEFQWRKQPDCSDYQLVTWSRDQSLRLWRIDAQLQKLCGHEVDVELPSPDVILPGDTFNEASFHINGSPQDTLTSRLSKTPPGEVLERATVADDQMLSSTPPNRGFRSREELQSRQQPKTLQQELSLVNIDIPNVTVDEMDALNRTFTVSAVSMKHAVKLTMTFPEDYPNNVPPTFQFGETTTLDKATQTKLIKVLCGTSLQQVKHNRSCIEPCLRQLVNSLDTLTGSEESPSNLQSPNYMTPLSGTFNDVSIPFPRTSGARFCSAGFLVCFTRMSDVQVLVIPTRRASANVDLTPRAMSALSYSHPQVNRPPQAPHYFSLARSPPSDGGISLKYYYNFKDRKQRPRNKQRKEPSESKSKDANSSPKKQAKTGPIVIYDVSCLLPIHQQLGDAYVLDIDDIPATCTKNATAAGAIGRRDLVQVWSLAALASSKMLVPAADPDKEAPWACHPFGRKLLKSLIDHYSSVHDVQTIAMLCCIFGTRNAPQSAAPSTPPAVANHQSEQSITTNYSPYHTIHPSDTTLKGWNFTVAKIKKSNSCSELYEEYRFLEEPWDPVKQERELHDKNMRLLDVNLQSQFDQFKLEYANILYRWQFFNKRNEVLKYVSHPPETHKGPEFHIMCRHCQAQGCSVKCGKCGKYSVQCSLCHIAIKGSASFCFICGHGGHSAHMMEWFASHTVCPTGCGCSCIHDNPPVE